jgi:hypothetical protein
MHNLEFKLHRIWYCRYWNTTSSQAALPTPTSVQSILHLAFIVELPARLFYLPRLEEKKTTQHPGNVQRTYNVNYTF